MSDNISCQCDIVNARTLCDFRQPLIRSQPDDLRQHRGNPLLRITQRATGIVEQLRNLRPGYEFTCMWWDWLLTAANNCLRPELRIGLILKGLFHFPGALWNVQQWSARLEKSTRAASRRRFSSLHLRSLECTSRGFEGIVRIVSDR